MAAAPTDEISAPTRSSVGGGEESLHGAADSYKSSEGTTVPAIGGNYTESADGGKFEPASGGKSEPTNGGKSEPTSGGKSEPTSDGKSEPANGGGYYDIMILGKTGMGKSTTADKLLLANPTHFNYEYDSTVEDTPTTHPIPSLREEDQTTAKTQPPSGSDFQRRKRTSTIQASTRFNDLSMWHLSQEQDLEKVTRRLKDLVYWRVLEDPHVCINDHRKDSTSTKSCELLSNDTSKIRVLDVPGFYGPEDDDSDSDSEDVTAKADPNSSLTESIFEAHDAGLETDLTIMRKILHIKVATNFNVNRILYFLPESGVLRRASHSLKMELRIMERYFKRSVFECMVVVATQDRSLYDKMKEGCEIFTKEEMRKTKKYFDKAMRHIFQGEEAPTPPIIYLSLTDTCDDVLRKIKESKVVREGVGLTFNPSTCARCGIHIGKLRNPKDVRNIERIDDIAIATNTPGSVAIPYEDTTCHPALGPKYTPIQCFFGGLGHLLTWKQFIGKWPYFANGEEVCINCHEPPKSRGCVRIGETFYHKKAKNGIIVNHTSNVEENYVFVLNEQDSIMRITYDEGNQTLV